MRVNKNIFIRKCDSDTTTYFGYDCQNDSDITRQNATKTYNDCQNKCYKKKSYCIDI